MRKVLRSIVCLLAAALAAAVGYFLARLRLSMPRTGGKITLPCLEGGVEIIYDRAGIPHISAEVEADAYRAVGYVMAQDRMVQMHVMLMVAKGRLAEAVGKMALGMDRFMRTVGVGRAGVELARNLDPESVECLDAFCEGVNAYLAQASSRLPFEFMFLGGRPEPWVPADCLTLGLFMGWLLDSFWPADLMREKLIRRLGLERAMELLPETADYNYPPMPHDGKPAARKTLEPTGEVDWGFECEPGGAEWLPPTPAAAFGSNNWVLSGSRTTTGKPILCGDPHVQHNAPGVLYMFHLKTPRSDCIGAGFPGLPIVVYGHNGYCGWSATSLCPDTQDLYVETFESPDSHRYLFKEEWVEAEVIEEEVRVRFSRPRRLKVIITRHGPVIKRKGNKGLALKWVSRDTSTDSLGAFLRQNRARSWDEFLGAMENFVGPAMNQVYADVDGNIGYAAVAKVPRRADGDGTIPCDGSSGECEWEGYVPFEKMPRAHNPEGGFLVTANSKVVGEGYPELITRAWEAPYRNGRIAMLLREREKHSMEDMTPIHGDAFTFPGKRFADCVVAASEGRRLSASAREVVERLREWDNQARADSPAMTIYFYSWQRLREKLLAHRLGHELFEEYTCGWTTVNLACENLLERKDDFWLPTGCGSYDELVLESLDEGIRDLEGVFGTTDQSRWKWGAVHPLTCRSLLGLFWPLDRIFNVGPVPRDGEGDTVNAAPPSSDCLAQLLARGTMGGCSEMDILPDRESHAAYGGPVLRVVLDFSDLDNSRAVLDVGQSGHRLSRHYKDHFPRWCAVEYFPLSYSEDKVAEQAASVLTLAPDRVTSRPG